MNDEVKAMSEQELENVSGGLNTSSLVVGAMFTTQVKTGYLALRTAPAYDDRNIIGQLWNGSTVTVQGAVAGNYVYVFVNYNAPGQWGVDSAGKYGYVNWNYLV